MTMNQIILGAALLTISALSAQAAGLANGKYTGLGDGSELTLTVTNGTAKIVTTAYRQCSGGGTGSISQVGNGHWQITMTEHGQCVVDVRTSGDSYVLEEDHTGECWQYSGQACSMSGTVSK